MKTAYQNAQEHLKAVETIQEQIQKSLLERSGSKHLMVWGLVWMVGFSGSAFAPPGTAGYLWMIVLAVGILASVVIGREEAANMSIRTRDRRVGIFVSVWWVYAFLIVLVSGVWSDMTRMGIVIAIFVMLGYVIVGMIIWRPLAWVGVTVTAVAVGSYLWLPDYTNVVMAFVGGGALFFSGLDLYRNRAIR